MREAGAKYIHEALQAGRDVWIMLDVIRSQKTRCCIDVAANQHGRVEITDNVFVVFGQGLISERRLRDPK